MSRKTRIWLDGQCLQTASRRRGVGRYVVDLFSAIARQYPDVELVTSFDTALAATAVAARSEVSSWIARENIHVWRGAALTGEVVGGMDDHRRLSEIALRHHVRSLDVDMAIATSPFEGAADCAVPFLPSENFDVPTAAIFYDAIPLRYPERYLATPESQAFWRRRLETLQFSNVNLCISAFGQTELRDLLPTAHAVNISAGIARSLSSGAQTAAPSPTLKPFALYVGGLDWRKNVSAIITAFAALGEPTRTGAALVMAGDHPSDRLNALRDQWRDAGLAPENLIALGHVPDRELWPLMRAARVVVQPSYMEGFGLVVAEALACGVPVLASRISAFIEVLGNDETMFDPDQPDELAARLSLFLDNPAYAADIARNQKMRSPPFSWERSAQLAMVAIADLVRPPSSTNISFERLRQKTADACVGLALPLTETARTLALAEPDISSPSRLIVDATQVARLDHGTGIQRVVKSICANLPPAVAPTGQGLVVAAFANDTGWFGIPQQEGMPLSLPPAEERRKLRFNASDTVLMLDSSWELWAQYESALLGARARGAKVVACLYDLVPIKMPAYCDPGMPGMFAQWLQSALRWSTDVVCISRAVADELLAILEAIDFPRSIRVGYWRLGADFLPGGASTSHPSTSLAAAGKRPKFLMVGTLEPRKGHALAIKAFEQFWSNGGDAELTIVGNHGWGVDGLVQNIQSHPEFGKRLFWRQYVADDELRKLYQACDSLIAASYGEGFGLPIVEAARFNKHVIASDIPVFHEVSERSSSVSFFEAGSSASLAREITSWLHDSGETANPRKAGQGEWPNWAQSASELVDVVTGRADYRNYVPGTGQSFVDTDEIGKILMEGPVPLRERLYRTELLAGPIEDPTRDAVRYIVRLINLSPRVWSSGSKDSQRFAVHLGCRAKDRPAHVTRVTIPFVIEPGGACIMSIDGPKSGSSTPPEHLEFGVFQDGVGWW